MFRRLDFSFAGRVLSECYLPDGHRGRPSKHPLGQLKALLLKRFRGIRSDRELCRRLRRDPELRRICDLGDGESPYHYSTLSRFRVRVGAERLRRLNRWLIEQLRRIGVIKDAVVAVDETFIPAYSQRDPQNTRVGYSDPEATLRRHGQRTFFGYGVMVAVDAESELPLATVTVPARDNEKRHVLQVVDEASTNRTRIVVADSQFSSRRVREALRDRGLQPVIPYPRTHRKGEWVLRVDKRFRTHGPEREQRLYRERGSVERTIGRLKEYTNLRENHARRLWRVEIHVQLCILCLLLSAYTAAANRREDLVRSITRINQ